MVVIGSIDGWKEASGVEVYRLVLKVLFFGRFMVESSGFGLSGLA